MGWWAIERSRSGRVLLEQAGRLMGVDASDVLRRGGPRLQRTEVLQPLMTVVCLAIHGVLVERGIVARWVAGHSLGEISAWSAAGGIAARDAVALAAHRGRAMGIEARARPGAMLAMTRCTEDEVREALVLGRSRGIVALGAHNAPDQWVLSGERPALQGIAAAFRGTWVPTSGAWHSPLMEGAAPAVARCVAGLEARPMRITMFGGGSGRIIADHEVEDAIVGQLTRPVRWVSCIAELVAHGMTHAIVVGPGRALRGLVRCIAPEVTVLTTESIEDLERIVGALHA